VNFPSLPGFGGRLFAQFKDRELALACVQAWNDYILDEWCAAGPEGLFVPMVITPIWDPPAAAKEIQRCAGYSVAEIDRFEATGVVVPPGAVPEHS